MAMICKSGARECDGCMSCQPEPEIIGECAACGDLIYACDDVYDIEGDLVHEECLFDWAEKYRVVS